MATFPSKVNYTTGEVLTAAQMNDIGGAINLLESAQFAAGKNEIINGDFGVWQRGTSFSNPASGTYCADRYIVAFDGTGATRTVSQQTFTPGTAPVSGYEGQYFLRYAQTVAGTGNTLNSIAQRIEDVRTYAGQTVTLSFWAKADAARSVTTYAIQNFGSGGSGDVVTTFAAHSVTTGWTRFTATLAIPSISGKTIGTSSYLSIYFAIGVSPATYSFDIWGVQLEAASTASNFQTATGTKQGELAACRYYYSKFDASTSAGNDGAFTTGVCYSTTVPVIPFSFPQMRVRPSFATSGSFELVIGGSVPVITALGVAFDATTFSISMTGTVTGLTAGHACVLRTGTSTAGVIELSAEL
jgi:hypothetical protein